MSVQGGGGLRDLLDMLPELKVVAAGVAGLLAWEAVASLLAPMWIGGPLDPTGLIRATLGIESAALAIAIHCATAILAYPAAYMLIMRPIPIPRTPIRDSIAGGAIYGVALWLFAMTAVAHYWGGLPLFLDWDPVVWFSLAGHVAYGVAMTGTLAWLDRVCQRRSAILR